MHIFLFSKYNLNAKDIINYNNNNNKTKKLKICGFKHKFKLI